MVTEGEKPEGVDIRTFIRSLENYFIQHDIDTDERKLQILHAQVSMSTGDALLSVNQYTGLHTTYEIVKQELLRLYPAPSSTDFIHASKAILKTELPENNMRVEIIQLGNRIRAVTESYLRNHSTVTGLSETTKVKKSDDTEILLSNIINNVLLRVVTAATLPEKVYEKLVETKPDVGTTGFTADTVLAHENYLLKKKRRSARTKPSKEAEILWKVDANYPSARTTGENRQQSTNQYNDRKVCYNCNRQGHVSRECRAQRSCNYCKKQGHLAKNCRLRIKEATGKYCQRCHVKDSHTTEECYAKTGTRKPAETRQNVRIANTTRTLPEQHDEPDYTDNSESDSDDRDEGEENNN